MLSCPEDDGFDVSPDEDDRRALMALRGGDLRGKQLAIP